MSRLLSDFDPYNNYRYNIDKYKYPVIYTLSDININEYYFT